MKATSARRPVRIQAGKWKGRKLEVPPGARPTSGRARAAFFDVVGPERLAGARVLDLFAGSGAVGFEAVSRGAAAAVLVESDVSAIARTCTRLAAAPEEIRVMPGHAGTALAGLSGRGEKFEIVFADPPYAGGVARVRQALDRAARLLTAGGILVVQADAGEEVPPPDGLRNLRRREYGRNVFHFFGIL